MGNANYVARTYFTGDACLAYKNGGCFAVCTTRRLRKKGATERKEKPDGRTATLPTCGPIVGTPLGGREFRVWARGRFAKYNGQTLVCHLVVQTCTETGSPLGYPVTTRMFEKDDFVASVTVGAPEGEAMFYRCVVVECSPSAEMWDASHINMEGMPIHKCSVVEPSNSASTSVVFGSCKWVGKDALREPVLGGKADVIFKTIHAQMEYGVPTHAMVMLGDNIYADDLNLFDADDTLDEFTYNYRNTFSTPGQAKLMASLPTIMQADDHDFWNNFCIDSEFRKGFSPDKAEAGPAHHTVKFNAAKRAFELYTKMFSASYDKPHNWFTCEVGSMRMFVMDTRLERRNMVTPRQMMNQSQLDAVKKWLSCQPANIVKIVATGVPFLPQMRTPDPEPYGSDTWCGYPEQRDELLTYIGSNQIRNVVFMSGDLHCGFCCAVDCNGVRVLQVVASPWYYPFGKAGANIFDLKPGDVLTSLANGTSVTVTHMSQVLEVDQFGRLTVDDHQIDFKIYHRKLLFGGTQKLLHERWPIERSSA
eukprot:TRINITY_DN23665_c0_g3_i1.p1 TRINITY_DN23665_c0_g3~~TRINITY_DN23665_c0_g3_i1.p1  ORF type:complete len:534 (-),score=53.06 TRINITY_DN23665_c0_g3_i1:153-1754(-)